ncbi:MAG: hypothetical protein QGM47_05465 [Actinomycetota bacterium]|nr:hypothetical protein [Actinomycetota bacterium]
MIGPTDAGTVVGESVDDSTRWDRFTNPSSSEIRVIALDAGTASFEASDGVLHLLWSTPGAGYVAQTVVNETTAVTISFSSNLDGWLVEAFLVDGRLEIVIRPAPIT